MIREVAVTVAIGMAAILLFILSFLYVWFDIPFIVAVAFMAFIWTVAFLFYLLKRKGYLVIER